MQDECARCGVSDNERSLMKCPMCHSMVCDPCCIRKGGKVFCQPGCVTEFFFGGEDEDAEEE